MTFQQGPGTTGGSLAAIDNFLHPFGFRFAASYTDWFDGSEVFLSFVMRCLHSHQEKEFR